MNAVPFYDLAAVHAGLKSRIAACISRVIASNYLVLGPEVEAFETEFAAYCGVAHGVGVASGLDALKLGLLALGVGPGDEVIVPGQTFIATWLAVSAVGATPVPVDVCSDTAQLDPAGVEAAVTARTAAVIAVHLFGAMAPMRELSAVCTRAGIALVEDAAQAHGAELSGRRAGSWSDLAAFSFYPAKNLGALGDGGIALSPHADVADRLRLLRNYGSRRKYEHDCLGENSRLDEIQAAVLRLKLPLLDGWNAARRQAATQYAAALSAIHDVALPRPIPHSVGAHHLMPVLVPGRDDVQQLLADAGVQTGIHYPTSPGRTAAYVDRFGSLQLVNSQLWATGELSLPIGPTVSAGDVDRVVAALIEAVACVSADHADVARLSEAFA